MNTRLHFCALAGTFLLTFASCTRDVTYSWYRPRGTQAALHRDLNAARTEAKKAYPSVKPFLAKTKKAEQAEEMLADMRNEIVNLYMVAHGWQLAEVRKGRGGAHE
jgi:hypothetical protein